MKQKLNKRERDSLKAAKVVIDRIIKSGSMDRADTEALSKVGASVLFTAKAFDYVR